MASPRTLRQFGILILVIGFISAGTVYWLAQRQDAEAQRKERLQSEYPDFTLSPNDSKVYAHDSELNMGKGMIVIDRFLHSIGLLFQGRNLAFVIAAVSVLWAIGCFALADRPAENSDGQRTDFPK